MSVQVAGKITVKIEGYSGRVASISIVQFEDGRSDWNLQGIHVSEVIEIFKVLGNTQAEHFNDNQHAIQ